MKHLFSFLFLLFFSIQGIASHVIGGNFTVTQTGSNTFFVEFRVYRDCINGNPGATIDPTSVRVYDNVTNAQVQTFSMGAPTITPVRLGDECFTPTGICIEEYYFSTSITLANNPNGYYFAWDICCRNQIIDNLLDPDLQGSTFYVQIPDPALPGGNSTPDFGPYPSDGYFCTNVPLVIDLGVVDPDGDSLVYYLVDPFTDDTGPKPFPVVNWLTPTFSLADIVGGPFPMSIDPVTGEINVQAGAIGTYVFAVKVEEFRNGVKIGETIRDVQYQALNCVVDDLPEIMLPDTLMIEVLTSGCFDVVVLDADAADTVSILISSTTFMDGAQLVTPDPTPGNPGLYDYYFTNTITGLLDTASLPLPNQIGQAYIGVGGIGLRYCWPTECEDIRAQSYELEVLAFSLGCSGDTAFLERTIDLFVTPPSGEEEVVPNVFSPNGDGKNDVFKIKGTPNPCYDELTVKIYNRWGQLVYESAEVEFEWNGKNSKGKDLPQGTYYVILTGTYGDKEVTDQYPLTLFR